jgi:hypothetical protein
MGIRSQRRECNRGGKGLSSTPLHPPAHTHTHTHRGRWLWRTDISCLHHLVSPEISTTSPSTPPRFLPPATPIPSSLHPPFPASFSSSRSPSSFQLQACSSSARLQSSHHLLLRASGHQISEVCYIPSPLCSSSVLNFGCTLPCCPTPTPLTRFRPPTHCSLLLFTLLLQQVVTYSDGSCSCWGIWLYAVG